ncbi:hypothetical protein C0Q63_22735 [Streptomyces albidoflavus]|nr:hypothetical protein C0Q63_22735 [Streptomyces albidoflavus]
MTALMADGEADAPALRAMDTIQGRTVGVVRLSDPGLLLWCVPPGTAAGWAEHRTRPRSASEPRTRCRSPAPARAPAGSCSPSTGRHRTLRQRPASGLMTISPS